MVLSNKKLKIPSTHGKGVESEVKYMITLRLYYINGKTLDIKAYDYVLTNIERIELV